MFPDQFTIEDEIHEVVYTLVEDQMLLRFGPGTPFERIDQTMATLGVVRIEETLKQTSFSAIGAPNDWLPELGLIWVATVDNSSQQVLEVLSERSAAPSVQSVSAVYHPADQGLEVAATVLLDKLMVRLQADDQSEILDLLSNRQDLILDEAVGDQLTPFYSFRVLYDRHNPQQSYDILNEIRALSGVEDADHGWMQLAGFYNLKPNDTEYIKPERSENYWGIREIHAEDSWGIRESEGGAQVRVAIVDGGFENHDDIHFDPMAPPIMFDGTLEHRTHGMNVAGIAAAITDNDCGTVGVGYDCLTLPLRLISREADHIALRIREAVNLGAAVINMSFGLRDLPSTAIDNIRFSLAYARNNNVVLVAAVGNANRDFADYPARDPLVIGVGAVDRNLFRRTGSNYQVGLNVVAPGDNCWTTNVGNGYAPFGATSCAAPHVTGLVALIRSIRPGLSADMVHSIIASTCRKIRQGSAYQYDGVLSDPSYGDLKWDQFVGLGLIDCAAAVKRARDLVLTGLTEEPHEDDNGPRVLSGDDPVDQYCGYLGRSAREGYTRIYCTLDLSEWIEVPDKEVVGKYPMDLTKPRTAFSRMKVSVRSGTPITRQSRRSI